MANCYRDCQQQHCQPAPIAPLSNLMMAQSNFQVDRQVLDLVVPIAGDIRRIIYPFAISGFVPPPDVIVEVQSLVDRANQVAGGDALEFLQHAKKTILSQMLSIQGATGVLPGNSPSYPINFAARAHSSIGTTIIRGFTDSEGGYSLFVPQNGTVETVTFYDRRSNSIGRGFSIPVGNGRIQLPRPLIHPIEDSEWDTDRDGLADVAEEVLGTALTNTDSDADGINDGAEILQGTDPLDKLPAITGVLASSDTAGTAVDISAMNDIAAIADSLEGVTLFNVQGQNPVRIAQVDTPGNALAVAMAPNLIGVADGGAGLAVLDVSDPPAARILHQITSQTLGGGSAQAITPVGSLAFVGTDLGWLSLVDLPSGAVLERLKIANRIEDLFVEGDVLYAFTSDGIETFEFETGIAQLGTAGNPMPNGINAAHGRGRMFVGDGTAWVVHTSGINTFDVSNPATPTLLNQGNEDPAQFGWKQAALNGSGLLLGAASPNQAFDGPHNVRLYDARNPGAFPQFLTEFETPGVARAVSIYNGLAYVADSANGLQVINYLAFDTGTNAPSISLNASFDLTTSTNGVAEEGKLVRVTASVADDVQVRNVEFYVDGVRLVTDGNFPFVHRFLTPRISQARTNLTVQARALDTGGNATWSDEIVVELVEDMTAPVLGRTDPLNGSVATNCNAVFAFFNEPMAVGTLNLGNIQLVSAGVDWVLGTSDDVLLSGEITYREAINAAVFNLADPLPNGRFRLTISSNVTDAAGLHLATAYSSVFAVLGAGAEGDDDNDGLSNLQELERGLKPVLADTDGDGWWDEVEISDGSDPLSATSSPRMNLMARPRAAVSVAAPEEVNAGSPAIVARPAVRIEVPFPEDPRTLEPSGPIVAVPKVLVTLPLAEPVQETGGVIVGKPKAIVTLPIAEPAQEVGGVIVGHPKVSVQSAPSPEQISGNETWLAKPPITINP